MSVQSQGKRFAASLTQSRKKDVVVVGGGPAGAVGFSFSLAPKDATNPDGEIGRAHV